ncbi:MAG: restriction endonuclease subunit S [Chlorobaculum sp.]|nr:restriction endonuclease subunit S [Chlorobaculum sp.]
MPNSVDKRRMKYVATINDESLSEATEPEYELQYIDIGNVDSYGTIHDIVSYKFENAPSRARRIVRDGDIIISTVRTYLQAIAPIEKPPENLIVSTGFAVVRPDRQIFDARFCKYAVREKRFLWEVESRSTGVSYPAINASDLADIKIGFPDLETQRLIADYLDRETARIDALVAEKETMLALLEEKRSALISQAVTRGLDPDAPLKPSGLDWLGDIPAHWFVLKLKYVVSKIGSGVTPRGGAESYQSEGIPLFRSQNIHFDGLRMDDIVYIDPETHDSMSNSMVLNGDIMLNITGASIGRCYYIEGMQEEANVNQHVCIVRPSSQIDTKFLYFELRSEIGQHQIDLSQSGSGREGLNFESLGNFYIIVPPQTEQSEIVDYLEKSGQRSELLLSEIHKSIERLKERRAALITAAVTGAVPVEEMRGCPGLY